MHKIKDINPAPEETLLKEREVSKIYFVYVSLGKFQIENAIENILLLTLRPLVTRD